MRFAAAFGAKLTHPSITRGQILFTCGLSFLAALVMSVIDTPFPAGFMMTAFASGVFHLLLFLFFNRVFPAVPFVFVLISLLNIFLLGSAIHFTGGIVSPFIFFFFCIIISDAANGIDYPLGLFTGAATYLTVILAEYRGILTPIIISAIDFYSHPPALLVVVLVTTSFMYITGQTYKTIMRSLRSSAEREFQEKQSVMKQLSKLEASSQIGLWTNKIVHDIRGPLGAIGGFIKMLQKENVLTEESEKDCEIITRELERIVNLTNRLILYTKPSGFENQGLCVVELLETVLAVLSFYPGAKKIEFHRRFPPPGKILISANKEAIQQVYFNILKNAVEATEANSGSRRIEMNIRADKGHVLIEAIDNGPGIPKERLARLGRDVLSTKMGGGGVGLLIAREIIETHGGRLDMQSQVGVGTRVRTWIPLPTKKSRQDQRNKIATKENMNEVKR